MEGSKSEEVLCTQGSCWVDVRDIAEAHVRSLEKEAAGGERIIVSVGTSVVERKDRSPLTSIYRIICLARLE